MDSYIQERRFEWVTEQKYQFWCIERDDRTLCFRWGRIGNEGQRSRRQFDSVEEAEREYDRKINEKRNSGYREVNKKKIHPRQKEVVDFSEKMQAHIPFIESICDDRDDLDSYAIYSDWLSENGNPLGDFIRMQIALEEPNLSFAQEADLERRTQQLFLKHREEWLGDLTPYLLRRNSSSLENNFSFYFRRGLLSKLSVFSLNSEFAKVLANSLLSRTLQELDIGRVRESDTIAGTRIQTEQADPLKILADGNYRCLRKLNLGGEEVEDSSVSDRFAVNLIKKAPRLRSLSLQVQYCNTKELFSCPFDELRWATFRGLHDSDLLHLIQSGLITQLFELNLTGGYLTNTGAKALLESEQFENLTELRIGNNRISSDLVNEFENAGIPIVKGNWF